MNKRGGMADLIFIIIILFALAACTLVGSLVYSSWKSESADIINTSPTAQAITDKGSEVMSIMDYVFLLVLVGLTISTLLLAFMIRTHPVLFFASLFMLAIAILIAAQFSNIYEEFIADGEVSSTAADYTITTYVMSHLPTVILIIGCMVLIFLFVKPSGGGQL